ncbi:TetR/AcrR family transcriptional regulator [Zhongshania sp.]|uniref:TetR/AcrR family transcriptional regulator n=1 Tax=Zhongshania sp. TaxID=1971902 RepID=UPI0035692508
MPPSPPQNNDTKKSTVQRRKYNSPLRQQQSAETRARVISAGAELVHSFPTWDWTNLTAKAVGDRAGVSERTVQRHFPTERKLRDAVIQRLVEDSGVGLSNLKLGDFANVTATMFQYLSSFSTAQTVVNDDPTFASIDEIRRDALLKAVASETPDWSAKHQETAAAVLDILWNMPPYERLIQAWGFEPERAVDTLTWLIKLIEEAIRNGKAPNTR